MQIPWNKSVNCPLPLIFFWRAHGSWLLKRASAIAYDADSAQIVVADKTGEVYSFPWPIPLATAEKHKTVSSLPPVDARTPLTKPTDDRFLGTFLLSHSSSIVACSFATAPWGRILVTADRDEHVRVSCFPETWVIAAMGLEHTAFVSCVAEVNGGIVSGGGDKRVIKWDYAGRRLREHQISQGSCVRLVRPWRDLVVVVGEREAKEGEVITSVVDILEVRDLRVVEQLTVKGAVLDIAFHGDVMFMSIDFDGVLIREYRQTPDGFKEVDTERWKILDSLETGAKVEIYWLESMRKLLGHTDDD